MKKIGFLTAAIIITGFFISGCATTGGAKTAAVSASANESGGAVTKTNYYQLIMFLIPTASYEATEEPAAATYENIYIYTDTLANYNVESLGYASDVPQDDLYDFFTHDIGASPEIANNAIDTINHIGNNVFVFEYGQDNNYCIVLYIEKQ